MEVILLQLTQEEREVATYPWSWTPSHGPGCALTYHHNYPINEVVFEKKMWFNGMWETEGMVTSKAQVPGERNHEGKADGRGVVSAKPLAKAGISLRSA